MSDKVSLSSPFDPDSAVQIIGETGGTVVYVFPGGDARVKKGKKLSEQAQDKDRSQERKSSSNNAASSIASTNNASTKRKTDLPQSRTMVSLLAHPGAQEQHSNPALALQLSRPVSEKAGVSMSEVAVLGQKLVEAQLISQTQLQVAQYDMGLSGMGLVEVLIARGWVTHEAIAPYV